MVAQRQTLNKIYLKKHSVVRYLYIICMILYLFVLFITLFYVTLCTQRGPTLILLTCQYKHKASSQE